VIVQGTINKECWRYACISLFAWKDEEKSRKKSLSHWHFWNSKRATSEYETGVPILKLHCTALLSV